MLKPNSKYLISIADESFCRTSRWKRPYVVAGFESDKLLFWICVIQETSYGQVSWWSGIGCTEQGWRSSWTGKIIAWRTRIFTEESTYVVGKYAVQMVKQGTGYLLKEAKHVNGNFFESIDWWRIDWIDMKDWLNWYMC